MARSDQDFQDLTLLKRAETTYPETPDEARLETFVNRYPDRDYWITFSCPEFTARCPVTNQPDFGRITIKYIPDERCIESKALKLYLYSFRNYNTFHEESVNRILDDVVRACQPRECILEGDFNARGGIAIHVLVHYRRP
jgi:7-cyano-7-deazaguanine reductase